VRGGGDLGVTAQTAATARILVAIFLGSALASCGSDGSDRTAASTTTEHTTTSVRPTTTTLPPPATTTTVATTTTAPPQTTTTAPPAPATTQPEPPREPSSYNLGTLTCATTGKTYRFYVRAFNGSIYAVDEQNQTHPYEISEQIGEWVHRDSYPQLDPTLPDYNPSVVEAFRLKGEDYLCAAGD